MNNQSNTSVAIEPAQACLGCSAAEYIDTVCRLPQQCAARIEKHLKPLSPVFLRLLLAYEFGEAGLEKLNGENWFADLVFPFPFNLLSTEVAWDMAMWLEIVGAIALLLGFMTRFFSAALAILTIVAIAAVHWPAEWHSLSELWQGYAITDRGFGNYKLPLMYLLMLTSLMFSGSGAISLDAWTRRKFCI